jgi:hypothetical protein
MPRRVLPKLRSKVSRRIFLTVLICTLVPITALVGMTLYNVQNRIEKETQQQLRHASKNIGMALFAELSSLEDEIRQRANAYDYSAPDALWHRQDSQAALSRIWFFLELQQPATAPGLTPRIAERLNDGRAYLDCSKGAEQLIMHLWVPTTGTQGKRGIAVAELNPDFLWTHALGFLPREAELIVIDQRNRLILPQKASVFQQVLTWDKTTAGAAEMRELKLHGQVWVMAGWDLFLKAGFGAPEWRILVAEPKNLAFAGLFDFRRNAFLSAIMTLWTVLLASSILVRQTLNPLQELKQATYLIGKGDFDVQLDINSGDEFEVLGDSFNRMTGKIKRQIVHQKQLGLAVRQVLGADSKEEAIQKFFNGLSATLESRRAGLLVYEPDVNRRADFWASPLQGVIRLNCKQIEGLDRAKLAALNDPDELFFYGSEADLPARLPAFEAFTTGHMLFFPVPISRQQQALLILADREHVPDEEQLTGVRQLTDQLGVALNRIAMTQDLQSMNIGILTALARAVDANSPWTHGHSERVTEYALAIGRELGFSEEDQDDLHRAGLLHDLGKVSIPSAVLNKPGKLSDDEYRLMQGHPAEGERIIEPIQAFSGIRTIIRQHHERWDGKGYPDGLSGEQIHPGARLMAVADVYDALYSDRPYRDGWPQEKVINFLREESGKMFEPAVVQVFLKLLEKDDLELACSSLAERQVS